MRQLTSKFSGINKEIPKLEITMPKDPAIAKYLQVRKGLDRPSTWKERNRAVNRFVEYLSNESVSLMEIKKSTILDFWIYMTKLLGLSINTAHQQLSLVKSFIRWCFESDLTPNPLKIFTTTLKDELPKPIRRLPDPPSQKEMEKILSEVERDKRGVFRLLYETGMRLSDLLNLKLSDLDFENRSVKIFQIKQQTERIAFLTEGCISLLTEYIEKYRPVPAPGFEDFLMISSVTGKQISGKTIQRWVKKYSSYAGTPITPHKIRAACATHMMEGGADIRHIQVYGGWQSLSTLEHYAAVSDQYKRKVWGDTHPLAMKEEQNKLMKKSVVISEYLPVMKQLEEMKKRLEELD